MIKIKVGNQKYKDRSYTDCQLPVRGFTLIELLVVMVIIGILASLSIFAMGGARSSARDARRKADLEQIRSGIEIYKADCNLYPPNGSLNEGSTLTASCPNLATYIQKVPGDPSVGSYCYNRTSNVTYELCAKLEDVPAAALCGCGANYKVTNP